MIVRLLFWQLDGEGTFEELRERLAELEPFEPPGTWLWNGAQERFGALVVSDEDDEVPAQVSEVQRLIGRDPDLYEEFDTLA